MAEENTRVVLRCRIENLDHDGEVLQMLRHGFQTNYQSQIQRFINAISFECTHIFWTIFSFVRLSIHRQELNDNLPLNRQQLDHRLEKVVKDCNCFRSM